VPEPAGDFGHIAGRDLATLYMGNSSTGAVTTKRELGLVVNDYFDYSTNGVSVSGVPQFVNHYWWRNGQNLFDTAPTQAGTQTETFARVRKLEVWVLPQGRGFLPDPQTGIIARSNAQQMYTVNVQVPARGNQQYTGGVTETKAYASNTQVTNVLPQFDTKWKKVLTCDMQRTFKSGVMRPYFGRANPDPAQNYESDQCLFSMSIVDPTSGLPYLSNPESESPLRVRVRLTIDHPIATFNRAQLTVYRNEEFGFPYLGQNDPDYSGTRDNYVQIDLSGARDFMS
jgi:hypothetical protein